MSNGPADKKQLGKILLQQKAVSPAALEELLAKQRQQPGTRLGTMAVEQGVVSEVELLKALSEQHGLPAIDLAQVVIPLENLKLVPAEIARQHVILPILVKDDRVFLAMADPSERRVIDEIEFVTARRIFPYVALQEPLARLIDDVYRLAESGAPAYVGPKVPDDYLRQIGMRRDGSPATKGGSVPPEPVPGRNGGGVVVAPEARAEDDDLLRAPSRAPPPGLDPAFDGNLGSTRVDQKPKAPGPTRRTILVVDDEEDIRRLLRRVLTEKGFEVIEASRGMEALQAVKDRVPDVILLDAMLPEIHGFEICRRIKGSKRYGHIPIIMVSAMYRGWRFAEDLKNSYGVEMFIEKPFKMGDVLSAVDRCLGGRSDKDDSESLAPDAAAYLDKGIEAYTKGDLDSAIAHLKQGLTIDPLAFRLHYHLGLLFGRREESVYEAIQELETAVDLSPRHFSALKNLAVLYQRAGFKHRAVEMWERALATAPDEETRRGIKDHLMGLL